MDFDMDQQSMKEFLMKISCTALSYHRFIIIFSDYLEFYLDYIIQTLVRFYITFRFFKLQKDLHFCVT